MTKEQVLEKAKELGVTLNDAEVEQFVKDGKLPEKAEHRTGSSVEELVGKYTPRQLAEMLVDTRGEAKDRRLESKKLKEDAEALTREINTLRESAAKYPELESKLKTVDDQLKAIKDGEKKRRELALGKLPEEKRAALAYTLNPDTVPSDAFDQTIALVSTTKSNGAEAPPPGGGSSSSVMLTPEQKREASMLGLSDEDYADVMKSRKNRGPAVAAPASGNSSVH